ncbi:MAG: tetratricopeptide repeat protein [Gammaproteobacteria bacterium]|nr:tetratricopeptide repeat protein [Gammaproteobacteria bacterium]
MGRKRGANANSTLAQHVATAEKLLRQGRTRHALDFLAPIVRRHPKHPDLLYCVVVAQRLLGDFAAALQSVVTLLGLVSGYGRAHQEHGYILLALNQSEAANQAFRQAVELNPGLLASWQQLRQATSDDASAWRRRIDANLGYLQSLAPELRSVVSLRHEKKMRRAEQTCRSYLQDHPKHVEAMRLLALMASEQGRLDDAEFLLESALEFDPAATRVRISYIDVLHKRQKYDKSFAEAEHLLATEPTNPTFRLAYANQLNAMGNYRQALEIYDNILDAQPDSALAGPRLWLSRGHALKTHGQIADAVRSYQRAYKSRPDFGDAYWSLANLKTYTFQDEELKRMTEFVQSNTVAQDDLAHLHFALGKAHEDRGEFEKSFQQYEQGNDIRRKQTKYDPATMTARLKLQHWVCNEEFFAKREHVGHDAPDPIFIVGLPRAGSTLLEQILASHSQVDGTLELHHIGSIAQKLDSRRRRNDAPRYPGTLSHLKPETFKTIGEQFIAETRVHRRGAPYFIDKMPNNFRHIGLIHLILPNAKIIDARRDPMSCCFSGFKQLFASGQEFTYGLYEIGTYYQDYIELMNHWQTVLPNRVLRVQYDDVVNDLGTQVNRILEYCELPFEQACIDFHRNTRAVRTPSAEQVRQPIYRQGLQQWENFEPWLGPLKEALGPALWSYRT